MSSRWRAPWCTGAAYKGPNALVRGRLLPDVGRAREAAALIGLDLFRPARSLLVQQIGIKGYHGDAFRDGVYPTFGAP